LEVRLLTESSFVEEFDTVVDEITDEYVRGEVKGDELARLEQYFLKARERQVKAKFASALIDHASATRGDREAAVTVKVPTLIARLLAFFSPQSLAFKLAATAVAVVVAVGIVYVAYQGWSTPQNLASIELTIGTSDRAEGPQRKSLRLAPDNDGARIVLNLPQEAAQYQEYQVELATRDGVKTTLEVAQHDSRTVTAIARSSLLKRGSYAVQLTGIKADGTPERVSGTYFFAVE
jgi:cell division protein FtsL